MQGVVNLVKLNYSNTITVNINFEKKQKNKNGLITTVKGHIKSVADIFKTKHNGTKIPKS